MRKYIVSILIFSSLMSASSLVLAHLQSDMQILAKNLAVIEKSDNVVELKLALHNMRTAALSAREEIPYTLDGKNPDNSEILSYKQGYDLLISQIELIADLLDKDSVSEAKIAAEKMKEIRNNWHMKFRF